MTRLRTRAPLGGRRGNATLRGERVQDVGSLTTDYLASYYSAHENAASSAGTGFKGSENLTLVRHRRCRSHPITQSDSRDQSA